MKIRRYQAQDMRTALRMIREQQGTDAVILSSKSVEGGVEVCAAADMEAVLAVESGESSHVAGSRASPLAAATTTAPAATAAEPTASWSRPGAGDLGGELRQMRRLLEQQLAALAWNDYTRREPEKALALAELAALGIARDVAESVVGTMQSDSGHDSARSQYLGLLANRILTCNSPLQRGGIHALVGTPGSGKTTTLAKLAARWVLEQGRDSVALVSTDEQRLGANEQLQALGRVLGVETVGVSGKRELAARLATFSGRRLVLIDTPGLSLTDQDAITELADMRTLVEGLRTVLVLPASAQSGAIEATLAAAAVLQPECAILSHVDGASSLGGALSALIRARLPVALLSTGANIPNDLMIARGTHLVARAIELASAYGNSADEDLLARRHAGIAHAAA